MASVTTNLTRLHLQLETQFTKQFNQAVSAGTVVSLTNDDFLTGTYIIDTPGVYQLAEDIVFNPNSLALTQETNPSATSWDSGDVLPSQLTSQSGQYDPKAYGLGFFAGIAITCPDVILDLNGFTFEQSKEHALQQRFFALIELADQPFISGQGPHSFGPRIEKATSCLITNGTLGRSSHHGIHGNGNQRILLSNLVFKDYEVCACALNGVRDLVVVDCSVSKARTDVPVVGTFSAGRFLRPYLNKLDQGGYTGVINVGGVNKNITLVKEELRIAMNNVFADLITNGLEKINKVTHLPEWKLFHNQSGVVDGNCYGFLTNSLGIAVLGFPDQYILHKSMNVYFKNVVVNQLSGKITEVLALPGNPDPQNQMYGSGAIQNDPVGALFQVMNRDADGGLVTIDQETNQYLGNVLTNAQALVAKAIQDDFDFGGLSTSRNSINYLTLDWMAGSATLDQVAPDLKFVCNGDSMFHVNKGVIGFKIDATDQVYMKNCRCFRVSNLGKIGSNLGPDDYINQVAVSHPDAKYYGYRGADTRAWSLASSNHVVIEDCLASGITSEYGTCIGFDVHMNSSDVCLLNCEATDIKAGDASDLELSDYQNNPTPKPVAYGFRVTKNVEDAKLKNLRVTGELTSPYEKYASSVVMNHIY